MAEADPREFARKYHAISWTHAGHTFSASVRKYLSENAEVCDPERIRGAQIAKGRLLEELKNEEKAIQEGKRYRVGGSRLIDSSTIDASFAGRATPGELKQTLWLATYLGYVVRPEDTGEPQTCTAQDFADWYLGMDCTGFVSAFLGYSGGRGIKNYDADPSRRRQAAKDVRRADVMIRKEGGTYKHIALVVQALPFPGEKLVLVTAESVGWKGKGVAWDVRRELVRSSPGVFALTNGDPSEFYLYPGS